MKKLFLFLSLPLLLILVAGCATTVPVTVTRPAELDLHGAKSISVLPFRISTAKEDTGNSNGGTTIIIDINRFFDMRPSDNPEEIRTANYLTDQLAQRLSTSPYFQLVNASAVQAALKNGTQVPADVYLTGKITDFSSSLESTRRSETDSDGNKYTIYYYQKSVRVSITYQIIDSKTNQVIAYKSTNLRNLSQEMKDTYRLPKDFDVIRTDIELLSEQILRELQPYEERVYIALKSDKTKDPDMKIADEMTKNGLIVQSEAKFLSIYKEKNSFVAGYNAAKLMQAQGKLYDARDLMETLVNTFGEKDAMTALNNINYEIAQAEKLKKQTEK
jgi:hypothetical protein